MDNDTCTLSGTLYFCTVLDDEEGIIGLSQDTSIDLMTRGFTEGEIGLTIREQKRGGREGRGKTGAAAYGGSAYGEPGVLPPYGAGATSAAEAADAGGYDSAAGAAAPLEGIGEGVRIWANLIAITVDDIERFQIRISTEAAKRLQSYGFRDLEPVTITIERLAHTHLSPYDARA
ncbi:MULTISPECIES: hypothetical protein [Gordonibacter]|uniref:Uncharacterized protein n=1 Tax=Gordonibacter faecis TaxID=3047475 RepID=A0ABT7DN01_9ACTN|nr:MULTISPECIES: hypothetical protein [unclassified Gordonibacter]MDJ1650903.1 hypothetical protein [Gordonibacter sp. KGMB12511]HIW77436.1 hypothetical protein [Candidatus Gordonibacter avicola]